MNPAINRALMTPLRGLWAGIQEHTEEVAATAQEGAEAAHLAEGAHAEEWGSEAMIHHVVDSNEWSFEPFGAIHLPEFPPFHIGGVEIDMSISKHVLFLMFATVLTVTTMWAAARASQKLDQGAEAPKGILGTMEAFYLYLRDEVVMANIGHGGERFVPLVITFFFFILYSNVLGLIPWGATATSNIAVTAALAIVAFFVIETAGVVALGPRGYLGTIFYVPKGLHPVMAAVMLVIMTPVEFIGKLTKPFALAVRLFANMTAGHFALLALLGIIVTMGSFTSAPGIITVIGMFALSLFVMFLEIFVALLQAYIFAMLVSVFIGLIRHAH